MSTATTETEQALCATSDEGLLRTFAALTHRIHTAEAETTKHSRYRTTARGQVAHAWSSQLVRDLRAQRDLVQAEVLRRMGSQ